ncbi:isocitrate lyase/PEP mutase family protein [Nitrincola alkalilacustris]|uniref:isocitrate lyase/PEP mutase family protein n=1 Tax=Nitrincola alkalilacustris TaxID=1571224 RepID=UPI00124C802B|nr:isocitrate lyase/phosphoenolpyruvate mutase family protein [Nitrincola alkalilacustris]
MNFSSLHQQASPLLIANIWDVSSAQAARQAGYSAIGTSSAAISHMLGYTDGEGVSFSEILHIISRVRAECDLPLSVDIEAGYADTPEKVIENLVYLAALGVVGVNIEDSMVCKGRRYLLSADCFAAKLAKIKLDLQERGVELFLNVRTDTFLLGLENAQSETIRRGRLFAKAGADGLFVPYITQVRDISEIVESVSLPLNVMCTPDLPAFDRLAELGVKRISMGNFIHAHLQQQLFEIFQNIQLQQSFQPVFNHAGY